MGDISETKRAMKTPVINEQLLQTILKTATNGFWRHQLAAILIIAGATAVRAMFFTGLGRGTPYLTYYPAVMFAALYGGLLSGLLATTVSALLCFFWIQTGVMSVPESLALATFVISCILISFICEALRRSKVRANLAETVQRERIKDLNCLYSISNLIENETGFDKILQGSADLMPSAWFHPEIACACINLGGRQYRTSNYRETDWRLSAELKVAGRPSGRIEVCYIEERPMKDEGPFLKEERLLINAIAERLGKVAERKQAEAALQASELQLHLLFNSGRDAVVVHFMGADGKPTYFTKVNDIACERLGYSREEMLKLSPQDIDAPDRADQIPAIIEKLIKTGHVLFETEHIAKDGHRISVEVSTSLLQLDGKQATLSVARDITERKMAEEALTLLVNQYKTALEEVKTLRGLIPICSSCKKIRTDKHEWEQIESYVSRHTEAKFSHGFCDDCLRKAYPEDADAILKERNEHTSV